MYVCIVKYLTYERITLVSRSYKYYFLSYGDIYIHLPTTYVWAHVCMLYAKLSDESIFRIKRGQNISGLCYDSYK